MKNIKGISTALCTTGISLAMALTMSFGLVGCSDSDSGASDEGSTYGSEEYLSPTSPRPTSMPASSEASPAPSPVPSPSPISTTASP